MLFLVSDLFLIQLSTTTYCPCPIVGWFSSFYNFLLLLTHQKRQSETFNLQFSTCLFSFCHLHPSQNQVTVCATAAIVRLLSKKSFSASPHLILPLLIILLGILHKSCSLQVSQISCLYYIHNAAICPLNPLSTKCIHAKLVGTL